MKTSNLLDEKNCIPLSVKSSKIIMASLEHESDSLSLPHNFVIGNEFLTFYNIKRAYLFCLWEVNGICI